MLKTGRFVSAVVVLKRSAHVAQIREVTNPGRKEGPPRPGKDYRSLKSKSGMKLGSVNHGNTLTGNSSIKCNYQQLGYTEPEAEGNQATDLT